MFSKKRYELKIAENITLFILNFFSTILGDVLKFPRLVALVLIFPWIFKFHIHHTLMHVFQCLKV